MKNMMIIIIIPICGRTGAKSKGSNRYNAKAKTNSYGEKAILIKECFYS